MSFSLDEGPLQGYTLKPREGCHGRQAFAAALVIVLESPRDEEGHAGVQWPPDEPGEVVAADEAKLHPRQHHVGEDLGDDQTDAPGYPPLFPPAKVVDKVDGLSLQCVGNVRKLRLGVKGHHPMK